MPACLGCLRQGDATGRIPNKTAGLALFGLALLFVWVMGRFFGNRRDSHPEGELGQDAGEDVEKLELSTRERVEDFLFRAVLEFLGECIKGFFRNWPR